MTEAQHTTKAKRGRRWRDDELEGKHKAERIFLAELGTTTKTTLTKILKKLGLGDDSYARKAYARWRPRVSREFSDACWPANDYKPTEADQRQPPGPRPAGMIWKDGCWQELPAFHDQLRATLR